MIVAIMQPYFFPYIGYFQLMSAVDTFVIYDDVQYINRGWVNRNRIASRGLVQWLTMPVSKAPREWPINKRHYVDDSKVRARLVEKVQRTYSQSAFFDAVFPELEDLINYADCNVARHNANSLTSLARKLGVDCRVVKSSEIEKPSGLKGAAKIIDICDRIGARHYINSIGGRLLYDANEFRRRSIELLFLETQVPPQQLSVGPQYLSIIDSLMREGPVASRQALAEYRLLSDRELTSTDDLPIT
jgi:hypothetical protein